MRRADPAGMTPVSNLFRRTGGSGRSFGLFWAVTKRKDPSPTTVNTEHSALGRVAAATPARSCLQRPMTDLLSDVQAPSDAELISSVRGGDVAAYGQLFTRHR